MVGRAAGAALALALAGRAVAAAGPPAPMEPRRLVKPGGGWFEEALGLEPGGARAALVRTDDATFARVEIVDLGTGATAASFDLPPAARPVERLELLPGAKEVLVIARRARPRVNGMEQAPLYTATLVDGAGRAGPTVGPAAGFVWRAGGPLLALERHDGIGGDVTYTLTPFALPTLAQAGKTHLAPHPGHPDRERFAALNQAQAGVDIVDEMGTSRPAGLAIPFELYDPKSLRDQEGPERGTVYFSLAVDPINEAAVKRGKPDLPMLDLYSSSLARGKATTTLRARLFAPRPVTWRAGYGKLIVLKRARQPARGRGQGSDELQIYELR